MVNFMTIIVAVKDENGITVGADKRVTSEDMVLDENSSKILIKKFKISEYDKPIVISEFLIAFSGVYSLFELLKTFQAPVMNNKNTFFEYLYKELIPSLNTYLRQYNFIQDYNGIDGVEWELLIVYQDKMYTVEFNLGIIEITSDYFASGTARDIAYGSLHTSHMILTAHEENCRKILPKFKVVNAINACAAHSTKCNDNMDLYQSKLDTDNKIWKIQKID